MTFGKGDHRPHRKRAAPPKARGRRTKELRKQARAQVQQAIENGLVRGRRRGWCRGRMSVICSCKSLWFFLCFHTNQYMFIRLFAPNYLTVILLNVYNTVYYIKMTVCRLRKTRFIIKEISESAMSHARSRKILLQNPQILTVVKCRPARSCQYWTVDSKPA
jgi:hypothetical protein